MKIGGPKGPKVPAIPEATEKRSPAAREPASFEQVLAATSPPADASSAPPVSPDPGVLATVAARVKSGEIDRGDALRLLVETIVQQRTPPLTAELETRLRAVLGAALAEDPYLAAKTRQLEPEE